MMECRQHWSLSRDVEIVMLNGLVPWGNHHLIPRGSLRESFDALKRVDIVIIHHADLISDTQLMIIQSNLHTVNHELMIFASRLAPSHFFDVKRPHTILPLGFVVDRVVLCVSAIGFPDAFVQAVAKIGPMYVERLDFTDHHLIQTNDTELIKERLRKLEEKFNTGIVTVLTEKDFARDELVFHKLGNSEVLVLCSSIKIMPLNGESEETFAVKFRKLLQAKYLSSMACKHESCSSTT